MRIDGKLSKVFPNEFQTAHSKNKVMRGVCEGIT